jgi:hypothetical protein
LNLRLRLIECGEGEDDRTLGWIELPEGRNRSKGEN